MEFMLFTFFGGEYVKIFFMWNRAETNMCFSQKVFGVCGKYVYACVYVEGIFALEIEILCMFAVMKSNACFWK